MKYKRERQARVKIWQFLSAMALLVLAQVAMADKVRELELGELDLQQYQGKVVYLDFWASWCSPCLASFPWMNKLHKEWSARGLQVVAVNVDANQAAAAKFLAATPADFPVVYDPLGFIAEQYQVQAMPSSFLVNAEGELVGSYQGFNQQKAQQIESRIAALLGLK